MKCIFIYNPVGGKGKIANQKDYIVKELQEKYETVDVFATEKSGDMTRFAREAVGKYDAIIFAGGDGSFNEVLQGIAPLEEKPLLGYIPSGTVNDVAHTLKIPTKLKKALKVIKNGRAQTIDCMKVNDDYAIYVVTAGAFTSATYNAPQIQKNHVGRLAYGFEGIRHNLKFQDFEVSCKGENQEVKAEECVLIAFMNSKYVAGFHMNKSANLQDGKIEVAIVQRKEKSNFLKTIGSYIAIAILFLFGYRAKNKNIIRLEGSSFDVDVADDVVWNVDGEKGKAGKVHIEVIPDKVRIIVPN